MEAAKSAAASATVLVDVGGTTMTVSELIERLAEAEKQRDELMCTVGTFRDDEEAKAIEKTHGNDVRAGGEAIRREMFRFWSYLRPEVRNFAHLIEDALRRNDSKGGWRNSDTPVLWLTTKLFEEGGELARLFVQRPGIDAWKKIQDEAGDVGAVAMMIVDVVGALPKAWR